MAGERGDKRTFATLDGLRGVAALFVAMRHTVFFKSLGIHGGYMAVDLFFVLSGFVIAHAYQRRLEQGLSPGRFLVMRYLRLWPLYVLGAVLGLIAAATQSLSGHDNMPLADVARTAPFALAMLPGPHIRPALYPVDSVAWSLALELAVNAVYAFAWRRLADIRVLAVVLAASALALIGACIAYGKLDVGFQWSDAPGGFARVAFSFTAGLAAYRLHRAGLWSVKLPAWTLPAVLAPLLWVRLDEVVYPLACAIVIFPLMVLAAAQTEPSRRATPVFAWLGAISFPLYALHKPCADMAATFVRHNWPAGARLGPLIGVPYLMVVIGVCALAARYYDGPARRTLSAGLDNLIAVARARLARDEVKSVDVEAVPLDQAA